MQLCYILFATALIFLTFGPSEIGARRYHRKDYRKIRSAADCGPHEEFTKCGPEPQCEISCDNLFSPPHCQQASELRHAKCYYPRCVCQPGYVRDTDGRRCISEWRCQPAADETTEPKRRHHHAHRDHASRHHGSYAARRVLGDSAAIKSNPFFFDTRNANNWW